MKGFWNRTRELKRLESEMGRGGFGCVTGRRRIGKTALLSEACAKWSGLYHQAVEGTPRQQLLHLAEEWGGRIGLLKDLVPRDWGEFFRLLARAELPPLMVLDEFPYLAAGDPALPSLLQKWIDHELPRKKTLFVVSGSSQAMLHGAILEREAPLFGRAAFHLHLAPMSYGWFCRALGRDPSDPDSFSSYALVGGVPRYWKLMPGGKPEDEASALYFEPSALLAEEPAQLFRDEGVTGTLPKAIIDFVGRGVRRPGEIASRLGTAHGNLSRPISLLLDMGLLERDLPFGESMRSTKKVLYRIPDPALAFYYGTYLPRRSAWPGMGRDDRRRAVAAHAGMVWEDHCRAAFPGSGRYWTPEAEFDLIAPGRDGGPALVAECKWSEVSRSRKAGLLKEVKLKFEKTPLSRKLGKVRYEVFSRENLGSFADTNL